MPIDGCLHHGRAQVQARMMLSCRGAHHRRRRTAAAPMLRTQRDEAKSRSRYYYRHFSTDDLPAGDESGMPFRICVT